MNIATLLALLGGLGGLAGVAGLLKVWFDHKRGKRAQTDSVALELVRTLGERVDNLEASLASERQRCDDELRLLRHRIGGWKQLFYSLLHLFDLPDRQRRAALETVRREMATLEQAEATETAAVLGARNRGDGE